jgi:hypothetical protein
MFCNFIILRLLNCSTETIQATKGRRYFFRGPDVGQSVCAVWLQKDVTNLPDPALLNYFLISANSLTTKH